MCTGYGLDSNGNKKEEIPRERKDLERDIFHPLGKYMFRRAYRMKKATFYKLHSLLKPRLDKVFFLNKVVPEIHNITHISSQLRCV